MAVVRLLRLLVIVALLLVIVVLGVANMQSVTLSVLPEGVVDASPSIEGIPLSVVILVSMLVGFTLGEVFEWNRERKHRREARNRGREIQQLRAENARLRTKLSDPSEDLPRIAAQ
ncbi:MAG: LapA family protein [Paracoccaceae bacterium]